MQLIPSPPGVIAAGQVFFEGQDLLSYSKQQMRAVRGKQISMIFQDPMTSLNPVMLVGEQIMEVIRSHNPGMKKAEARARAGEMLEMVGIPAERKIEYPHQFSGGMKQRIVIAIALACNPKLLLADEPTTALDVTIQAQVLKMMNELKEKFNTSMILITHDLGVVAQICDWVAIMYAGEIIEHGTVEDIFDGDRHHPYTIGLFGSIPDMTQKTARLNPIDGLMPDPSTIPPGCRFVDRCPKRLEICSSVSPEVETKGTHQIKCHLFSKTCGMNSSTIQTSAGGSPL